MLHSFIWLITFISIVFSNSIPVHPFGDDIQPGIIIEEIIGGQPASINQAPWQIWLVEEKFLEGERGVCGGSIINKRAVLTAAHCCDGALKTTKYKIKYGGIDRNKLKYERDVTHILINPKYNRTVVDGDWCLLILNKDIEETNNVKIIEIADKVPAPGTVADLTGWGMVNGKIKILPSKLQHGLLTIISQEECAHKWNRTDKPIEEKNMKITGNMVCAESISVSGCHGDSGGPLVVDKKLVGIVSSGPDDCRTGTKDWPNFYGNAVVAKKWIFEQIHKYIK